MPQAPAQRARGRNLILLLPEENNIRLPGPSLNAGATFAQRSNVG